MALIDCSFYSETLGMPASVIVILPRQLGREPRGRRHPVLTLLHGLSDDHTAWLRQTAIERYAASRGLAVVMPNVHRSFCVDMKVGPRYGTFLNEELPEVARDFFPLSVEREHNFVAGLSMGGYGAFMLALRHPEKYAAAASLSGVMDAASMFHEEGEEWRQELATIFGSEDEVRGSDADLFELAARAMGSESRPRLYQCCGSADQLLAENRRFRSHAKKLRLQVTYHEGRGGHDWAYWDTMMERVVDWLPM